MSQLVSVELLAPPDRVAVSGWVWLRFTVTRPELSAGPVVLPAGGVRGPNVSLNADLFTQDVRLSPGDTATLCVGVRFDACGPADFGAFTVQVNPEAGRNEIVPLPAHPVRVVPSLGKSLAVRLTRVCGYDDAVKVEAVAANVSPAADLTDVEIAVGPADAVRSGPLRRRERRLKPGEEVRFDLVLTTSEVQFDCSAAIGGEQVEARHTLNVPTEEQARPGGPTPFRFLEPRMLTTDRVTLSREGKAGPIAPGRGVYPVHGDKSRYELVIDPSHPHATDVRLYPAAGQVEVERVAKTGRQWPFVLTVVENPTLSRLVRLDYDVQVQGTPLRGEIYLSIRPTQAKAWTLAATAGAALTLKGSAALFTALARSDGGLDDLLGDWHELFTRRWWEWAQLLSIPVIRYVLWGVDRVWRPFQEG